MEPELERFVRDALARGEPRERIGAALRSAGWEEDRVRAALAAWAEIDFPLPVPRPRPYLSAREAFLYLVLFATLYTAATSLGVLCFQFVNHALTDPVPYGRGSGASAGALRWGAASLLTAFPLYLLLSHGTGRALARDPEKRASKVHKWLTYLTLFVGATVLIGDLIALVSHLLEGELTARFLLKALAVAAIAGSVFGYYLWELREDDRERPAAARPRGVPRIAAAASSVAVGAALAGAILLAGSPRQARAERLDALREGELQGIAWAIDRYWELHGALPATLGELAAEPRVAIEAVGDPVTGAAYEYRPAGGRAYELCATFDAASEARRAPERGAAPGYWRHPAGRHCFALEARREP